MPTEPYPSLTCKNCGETKSALHFPKRSGPYYENYLTTDPRRYDTQCKRCKKPAKPGQSRDEVTEPKIQSRRKNVLARYRKPKPKRERLSPSEYKRRIRVATRIKSMRYMAEKGCAECGERDPRVLEYDHKDPTTKKRNIARLIIDGYGWSSRTLRAEIRKCRILCANCHRKHTIEQQGYYAHEDVQKQIGVLAARYKFDL